MHYKEHRHKQDGGSHTINDEFMNRNLKVKRLKSFSNSNSCCFIFQQVFKEVRKGSQKKEVKNVLISFPASVLFYWKSFYNHNITVKSPSVRKEHWSEKKVLTALPDCFCCSCLILLYDIIIFKSRTKAFPRTTVSTLCEDGFVYNGLSTLHFGSWFLFYLLQHYVLYYRAIVEL